MRGLFLGFIACTAIACSETSPTKTVTVCRGNSCVEQDSSVSTIDPASVVSAPAPTAQVTALEALARDKPSAAYDLALRYFRGDGVPQDSYKALQWMRTAAEGGDVHAQAALGRLYFTGLEEMGPDLRESQKWLTIAAGQGDKEAKELLPQVQAALADDQAYTRRLVEWRYATQYYWSRGWAYRWYWDPAQRSYLNRP